MKARSKIEYVEKALAGVILGLLGTIVLVNILGFISPIWVAWRYETVEESVAHSRDVLELGRTIGPWFSLLFLYGAWQLAQTQKTIIGRWTITLVGALVSATYIGEALYDIWANPLIGNLFYGFQFLSLLLFLALIRRVLQST
jgi:hypothetical protein